MKIACLRIVLRHVPVLQLHVHVQAQVMIRLEMILSILVYTFFTRMFDFMLPLVVKYSIVAA